MTASIALILLLMAGPMAGSIVVYENLLRDLRAQRDEALADADLATDLFMAARERHPSSQYGGGNLRVVK